MVHEIWAMKRVDYEDKKWKNSGCEIPLVSFFTYWLDDGEVWFFVLLALYKWHAITIDRFDSYGKGSNDFMNSSVLGRE